jgi:uncharacterized protein (DUF2249 family)
MSPTAPIIDPARFDVREMPCKIKHGLILQRFEALLPGEHFVLVNGHDPVPLYHHISALFPGQLGWDYEERGPEVFAIRIAKLAPGMTATPFVAPPGAPTKCDHDAPASER